MRKSDSIILGLGIAINAAVLFVATLWVTSSLTARRNIDATVISVNDCTDLVSVEDKTGKVWKCLPNTDETFNVGDKVTITIYDNGTDLYFDDDMLISMAHGD